MTYIYAVKSHWGNEENIMLFTVREQRKEAKAEFLRVYTLPWEMWQKKGYRIVRGRFEEVR